MYIVSLVHIETDEVLKTVKVFNIDSALRERENLESQYNRKYYEVNIASL